MLLDAVVETRLAWFFLHDSDDRFGVLPDDGRAVGQAVETADGVCILLGDEDGSDEVPVRVRVVRDAGGSADGGGDLVFDKTLFLYGAGLVVEDGFPSTRHLLELGGPGAGARAAVPRPDDEPARRDRSCSGELVSGPERAAARPAEGTPRQVVQVPQLGSSPWRFATSATAD